MFIPRFSPLNSKGLKDFENGQMIQILRDSIILKLCCQKYERLGDSFGLALEKKRTAGFSHGASSIQKALKTKLGKSPLVTAL